MIFLPHVIALAGPLGCSLRLAVSPGTGEPARWQHCPWPGSGREHGAAKLPHQGFGRR
jgi:hypothetical protein